MSDILRFRAPGPWITRELRECVLASDYDALAAERARAVLGVREWLLHLATRPGRINKTEFRQQAALWLKHYPTPLDMKSPGKAFGKCAESQSGYDEDGEAK